jgi:hypothetical protein
VVGSAKRCFRQLYFGWEPGLANLPQTRLSENVISTAPQLAVANSMTNPAGADLRWPESSKSHARVSNSYLQPENPTQMA